MYSKLYYNINIITFIYRLFIIIKKNIIIIVVWYFYFFGRIITNISKCFIILDKKINYHNFNSQIRTLWPKSYLINKNRIMTGIYQRQNQACILLSWLAKWVKINKSYYSWNRWTLATCKVPFDLPPRKINQDWIKNISLFFWFDEFILFIPTIIFSRNKE